jgi:Zn-finger nucleic acid-binding protein
MRKPLLRLACPACLGVVLERAPVADGLSVDHCGRCGGTWLLRANAVRLRAVPAAALRAMVRRSGDAGFLCHDCHAPMDRDAMLCGGCGWANVLECPGCGTRMRRETHQGVTVDVCRGCAGIWLDHHELSTIWEDSAGRAVARRGRTAHAVGDAGGFLLDALWFAPDATVALAHVSARAAGAGLEAAAHAAGAGMHAVANAPGAAVGMMEMIGDAAGAVFGLIADVIGGIFDGIG